MRKEEVAKIKGLLTFKGIIRRFNGSDACLTIYCDRNLFLHQFFWVKNSAFCIVKILHKKNITAGNSSWTLSIVIFQMLCKKRPKFHFSVLKNIIVNHQLRSICQTMSQDAGPLCADSRMSCFSNLHLGIPSMHCGCILRCFRWTLYANLLSIMWRTTFCLWHLRLKWKRIQFVFLAQFYER